MSLFYVQNPKQFDVWVPSVQSLAEDNFDEVLKLSQPASSTNHGQHSL